MSDELDDFLPRDADNNPIGLETTQEEEAARVRLGVVVGGSLSKGLTVKLDSGLNAGQTIENMAVGRYVVAKGLTERKFFSIVTDIILDNTNPAIEQTPPPVSSPFLSDVYRATVAYGRANVSPMLVLDPNDKEPRPNKTIPAHFSPVFEATEEDVNQVFGEEDDDHFHIGSPLDMEGVKVNLDLNRFVERSSGVFGKSGTGKSFITRTLLAAVIAKQKASCLIFDMHSDYGWEITNERGKTWKGLTQILGNNRPHIYTLDKKTSLARNNKIAGELQIQYSDIEPADVEMLSSMLNLSDVQTGALYYLHRKLGEQWVAKLLDENGSPEIEEIIEEGMLVKGTLSAIQRKFELFRRMDFLVPKSSNNVVGEIFEKLQRGTSIVLEFGKHGDNLPAYMLVANYLTRRVHGRYVQAKNDAVGSKAEQPKPLMIVIEEAHKFLDPEIAKHTIFGTIARELRKYNVTLLVVDQRPSGIDDEVMSQIGTRVTALLDNEADIRAVFSGVSGASALREVLARLDTQQQALILGHAVPMPVVIRTRDYDEELYRAVGFLNDTEVEEKTKAAYDDLW